MSLGIEILTFMRADHVVHYCVDGGDALERIPFTIAEDHHRTSLLSVPNNIQRLHSLDSFLSISDRFVYRGRAYVDMVDSPPPQLSHLHRPMSSVITFPGGP